MNFLKRIEPKFGKEYERNPGFKHVKAGVGIWDRVPRIPRSGSQKFGTGTETNNKILDRDSSSKFAGFGTGTETLNSKIREPGLRPGPRFVGRGIPGLNYSGLSRGLKRP